MWNRRQHCDTQAPVELSMSTCVSVGMQYTDSDTDTHACENTLARYVGERERETVEESERDTKDIDVCGCIIYTHAYIHTYIDNYMHT